MFVELVGSRLNELAIKKYIERTYAGKRFSRISFDSVVSNDKTRYDQPDVGDIRTT